MPHPHIVHIHSHDTGRYIQPYHPEVATPRLQQFAEEATLFRHAFCANPTCSPSRAALATGQYPHVNGMIGLTHRGPELHHKEHHLANFLKDHGYQTAVEGVCHCTKESDRTLGFQRLLGEESIEVPGDVHWDEAKGHRAAAFIAEAHERPFFLSVGFTQTHRIGPWHNAKHEAYGDPRHAPVPDPLPDAPEIREDFADFLVAARQLDRSMGVVLDAIDRAGLRENTLVIITTDHGIAYPFMKCNLTDHGIGVMLMMRGPGPGGRRFGEGLVVDPMVSHLDLFPTICHTLGVPAPDRLEGKSLAPLLDDPRAPLHEAIFAEVNYHASYEPKRAVRTERYKYIRRLDPRPHPVLPNCDPSASKDYLLARGWRDMPQEKESLYDLAFDPHETDNRAGDPACAEVLEAMRDRLDRWMEATNDPARRGAIPHVPGMKVNPVEGETPTAKTLTLP